MNLSAPIFVPGGNEADPDDEIDNLNYEALQQMSND